MHRTTFGVGLVLLLTLALALPMPTGHAQTTEDTGLLDGMRQVDEGEFDSAILTLDTAARRLAGDPKRIRELSQAYLYLGIAYVGKGHEAAAKAKFREALAGMKDLSLSAERYPPKVVDLFEAARADARAAGAPAATTGTSAPPAGKKKGGSKGLLLIGGVAVIGGGAALAAGGGDSGGSAAPPTTTPSQTFNASGTAPAGTYQLFTVTTTRPGTMEATVTWPDRNLRLVLSCQERNPPYTDCGGTYNRTSDTTARYVASVQQKEYHIAVNNYDPVNQPFTIVISYP